jgi:hypothetical protein
MRFTDEFRAYCGGGEVTVAIGGKAYTAAPASTATPTVGAPT